MSGLEEAGKEGVLASGSARLRGGAEGASSEEQAYQAEDQAAVAGFEGQGGFEVCWERKLSDHFAMISKKEI